VSRKEKAGDLPAGEADRYAGRPSVCRSCGALVGAGESSCAQCGAPLIAQASQANAQRRRPVYDRETMIFARAILARPAPFTTIFLVANILLYLLMTFSGGADGGTLVAYGAKLNSLIKHGEWWRFVTPLFLHITIPGFGPLHIIVNMYGLWMLGPYVERLYGSAKFVVFWILTGIAGVVASYLTLRPSLGSGTLGSFLFKVEDTPSAGASGALFGLIGVLFVFGLKFRNELPAGFKRAFGAGMLPTIFINLFIGFLARRYIDNAAHLGGFVSGAVLALVVGYKRPGARAGSTIFWRLLQTAALALVVVSFFMVWRHYDGLPPSVSALQKGLTGGWQKDASAFLDALSDGQKAFLTGLKDNDAKDAEAAINKLNNAPHLDDQADGLRNELKELIVRARSFINLSEAEQKTRESQAQLKQLLTDFKSWKEKYRQWVKTDGAKYGIVLTNESANQNSADEK
jgi:rhomboid protease GluP